MSARFYTIPSDFDFLDMLARRLVSEAESNPLDLQDYNIILPSYEAVRILRQKMQDLNGGKPTIMPQIITLNQADDEALPLRLADDEKLVEKTLSLPSTVSSIERELFLTREILKHPETADSVSNAAGLARELAQFIDELHAADVPLKKLSNIDVSDFAGDLNKTQNLLKIVTDIWPAYKQEKNVLDAAERQNKVLSLLEEYVSEHKLSAPFIFAGFNRTTKRTRSLLAAMNRHQQENVSVIFQGLDMDMGESWETIGPAHPQHAHKKMLDAIKVDRKQVHYWYGTTPSTHSQRAKERLKLLREAMRPSETTHKWKSLSVFDKSKLRPSAKIVPEGSPLAKKRAPKDHEIDPIALTGMDMIVAGTQQEEVSSIALKFREMLEKDGMTGALITPDAELATRVAARLQGWDIKAAPEGGGYLLETQLGRFIYATVKAAANDLAPVSLLDLLKSPFSSFGENVDDTRKKTTALEDMVLRGPRPWPGFDGLDRSLKAAFNAAAEKAKTDERKNDLKETRDALEGWIKNLREMVEAQQKLFANEKPQSFKELVTAHLEMMEAAASTNDTHGAKIIWSGEQGRSAQKLFSGLLQHADIMPDMTGAEYLSFIQTHLARSRYKCETHPRIKILTPEMAHMMRADVNIVAGLTEENWPGRKREKFWLSPELREKLGLDPMETEIGNAAFDFVQAVSNKYTVMTRAERNSSAPTVSSPFITRLNTVLKGLGIAHKLEPKSKILEINASLHRPAKVKPIDPPAPRPPEKFRPRRFSVSAIERLLRDPYAVYARHVLKLYPKAPVDADPSAAERGNIIHAALEDFKKQYPDKLPKDALPKLLEIGEKAFEQRMENPSVRAFWWPRFERMAEWFINYERAREGFARTLKTEVPGRLNIETEKGKFVLTAIADRIDALMDDSLSIIDYKTGGVPTKKDVEKGISPQLTLEALIALSGGFEGIDAKDVGMTEYWKLSGGRPAGKVTQIEDIDRLQAEALEGLTKLLTYFARKETPYLTTPRPAIMPKYLPYDQLSRSFEWGYGISRGLDDKVNKKKAAPKKKSKKGGPKK